MSRFQRRYEYSNNYINDDNDDEELEMEEEEEDDDYYYYNDKYATQKEDQDDYDYYDDEYYDDYYDDEDYYDDDYYEGVHYYNQINSIENKYRFDNKSSFTKIVDKTINPEPYLTIKDNYLNVLMIAEKPSIARTIAKILSKKKSNLIDRTKKYHWCLFEFYGDFKGKAAHFVVSSVAGHMYQTEFLRMHQKFDIDPSELFDAPTVKTECDDDSFITADWLNKLAKGKDILCLWLDCDREGENICYEVIHNVLPYMNKKSYQQIYRAIFSSLAKDDIFETFETISNYPDNNLSLAVDAREVIDLKIGVSLTRFLTSNILPLILDDKIKTKCLSYGPCQTPTLWFCVKRQKELENQNLDYYKIYIKLKVDKEHIVKIFLNEDYKNKADVEKIVKKLNILKERKRNLEIKIKSSEKRKKEHPLGLNTANMLKLSSTQLGLSPQATMNIAEKLYTQGYITYPRTETTQYAPSFDFKDKLMKFSKDNKYKKNLVELIKNFDEEDISILNGGIDAGDHPPITPARNDKNGRLQGKELELFDLICQYYFASLSPDLEYENLTYEFEVEEETYDSSCSVIKTIGFLKFLSFQKKEFITDNEVLQEGKEYEIDEINYEKRQYNSNITEAELIEEMEKNHIGTDASMSVHITNIERRGYVTVDDKRRMIPTKLGKALIEALEAVEPDIVLPKNRATIEEFVSNLAEGKKEYDEVLDYALEFYKKKYISISSEMLKIYKIFSNYFDMKKID